jgi:hypothetical protein
MNMAVILIGLFLSRKWREQLKTEVHKSLTPGRPKDWILFGGARYLWGPSYGTCLISPFRPLEFWGGCYIFGKFVHPWLWYAVVSRWRSVIFICAKTEILTLSCVSLNENFDNTSSSNEDLHTQSDNYIVRLRL